MDNLRLLYENDEDFALMAREHALDFVGTTSMTFAKEWLESAIGSEMRQSTPEERAEYERMRAKYSTNVGANIFDLERQAEIPDSREKLEADIREYVHYIAGATLMSDRADEAVVHGWLDRQAAITERECLVLSVDGADAILTAENAKLQEQVDRLTAERDNLVDNLLICNSERERYREAFGEALDKAAEIVKLQP